LYYEEIKKLFHGKRPSVNRFKQSLKPYSSEEQDKYYQIAYRAAINEWERIPEWYREFFITLVKNDRQRFLDFLLLHTIIGSLRYTLQEPDLLVKLLHLLERKIDHTFVSFNHLSFSVLLAFQLHLKISTLGDKIRTATFFPEELLELFEQATISV